MGAGDRMRDALKLLLGCPQPSYDKYRPDLYRRLVCTVHNETRPDGAPALSVEDTFVVWSCRTLENFKCLIGSHKCGTYYECTLDGDKDMVYVDAYEKRLNRSVSLTDALRSAKDGDV